MKTINGTPKHNGYIAHAIVDKNWNMYSYEKLRGQNELFGACKKPEIVAHTEYVELLGYGAYHIMDALEYRTQTKEDIKKKYALMMISEDVRIKEPLPIRALHFSKQGLFEIFANHEKYSKKNGSTGCVLIGGGSRLLTMVAPIIDQLYLTKINDLELEGDNLERFPLDVYQRELTRRTDLPVKYGDVMGGINEKLSKGHQLSDYELECYGYYLGDINDYKMYTFGR